MMMESLEKETEEFERRVAAIKNKLRSTSNNAVSISSSFLSERLVQLRADNAMLQYELEEIKEDLEDLLRCHQPQPITPVVDAAQRPLSPEVLSTSHAHDLNNIMRENEDSTVVINEVGDNEEDGNGVTLNDGQESSAHIDVPQPRITESDHSSSINVNNDNDNADNVTTTQDDETTTKANAPTLSTKPDAFGTFLDSQYGREMRDAFVELYNTDDPELLKEIMAVELNAEGEYTSHQTPSHANSSKSNNINDDNNNNDDDEDTSQCVETDNLNHDSTSLHNNHNVDDDDDDDDDAQYGDDGDDELLDSYMVDDPSVEDDGHMSVDDQRAVANIVADTYFSNMEHILGSNKIYAPDEDDEEVEENSGPQVQESTAGAFQPIFNDGEREIIEVVSEPLQQPLQKELECNNGSTVDDSNSDSNSDNDVQCHQNVNNNNNNKQHTEAIQDSTLKQLLSVIDIHPDAWQAMPEPLKEVLLDKAEILRAYNAQFENGVSPNPEDRDEHDDDSRCQQQQQHQQDKDAFASLHQDTLQHKTEVLMYRQSSFANRLAEFRSHQLNRVDGVEDDDDFDEDSFDLIEGAPPSRHNTSQQQHLTENQPLNDNSHATTTTTATTNGVSSLQPEQSISDGSEDEDDGEDESDLERWLLEQDENIARGRTVLDAVQDLNLAELRNLIANGADVNVSNSAGETPLHIAVSKRSRECVLLLLQANACVNVALHLCYWTPLHKAAARGDLDLVKLLVEFGADVHAEKSDRNVPWDVADQNHHEEVCAYLQEWENREDKPPVVVMCSLQLLCAVVIRHELIHRQGMTISELRVPHGLKVFINNGQDADFLDGNDSDEGEECEEKVESDRESHTSYSSDEHEQLEILPRLSHHIHQQDGPEAQLHGSKDEDSLPTAIEEDDTVVGGQHPKEIESTVSNHTNPSDDNVVDGDVVDDDVGHKGDGFSNAGIVSVACVAAVAGYLLWKHRHEVQDVATHVSKLVIDKLHQNLK